MISVTSLLTARNTADQTSYTTASTISPTADTFVLGIIRSGVGTGTANVPSLSGGLATWSVYDSYIRNTGRITLGYGLAGSSPTPAQVVIDFAGQTQEFCEYAFVEVSGTVLTGTNGIDAIVQWVEGTTGANAAAFSLTLAAFAAEVNAALAGFAVGASRTVTATAPATLVSTVAGSSSTLTVVSHTGVTLGAEFTGTNAVWFGFAIELAAQTATAPTFAYPRVRRLGLSGGLN